MPNKTETGARVSTRTQKALDKENNPTEQNKQTPNKQVEERKKNYKPNNFEERKYFSVQEDYTILKTYTDKKASTSTRDISEALTKKMTHSSESIRDRIKRYISKLSSLDIALLKEESTVSVIFICLKG